MKGNCFTFCRSFPWKLLFTELNLGLSSLSIESSIGRPRKKLLCVENVGLQAPGQDLDPICCPLLVGLVHPNSSY